MLLQKRPARTDKGGGKWRWTDDMGPKDRQEKNDILITQCGTFVLFFSSLCPLQNVVNTVACPTTAQSPTREYSYFHKEAGHLIPHDGVKAQRGQIQLLCNVDGVWFPQGQAGLPPLKCCDCPQMW